MAKAGIARTFQNIRLFPEMTALENVMVGRHVRSASGLAGAIFRTAAFRAEESGLTQAHTLADDIAKLDPELGETGPEWAPVQ